MTNEEYIVCVGKPGPPLTEEQKKRQDVYYRQLDGELITELSPKARDMNLPYGIMIEDVIKLYCKYDPEWEDRLWDCMRKAIDQGELKEDDKGVAVIKIKPFARKLIEGKWQRCNGVEEWEPQELFRGVNEL